MLILLTERIGITRPGTIAPSGLDLRTACSGLCWRRYVQKSEELYMKVCDNSTDYELLAQRIYQDVLGILGFETEIYHNVKVSGRSGVEHQIDVFWKLEEEGFCRKILVECKHYKESVSLIHARNLLGLIHDIPDSRGVLITTVGFQSGVVDFCNYYGIDLKLIRRPKDDDWTNGIRYLKASIVNGFDSIDNLNIVIENGMASHSNDNQGSINDINSLVIKQRGVSRSVLDWIDSQIDKEHMELNIRHELDFKPSGAYLLYPENGKSKIKSVSAAYCNNSAKDWVEVDALDFTQAVLEDFRTQKVEYFAART